MRLSCLSLLVSIGAQLALGFPVALETRQAAGVDQATYSQLERYAKFCVAALQVCARPLGTNLVKTLDHKLGTEGYITRDDGTKEVIVAFRGTDENIDIILDVLILLLPLTTPGVTDIGGAKAHTGFQLAYNAVAKDVIATVKSEIAAHPGYKVTVIGHSLGGAVASIGALSLKAALPDTPLQLFTYGQPRVGNKAFKNLVETRVGIDNVFRSVHTNDGTATLIPTILGFSHFGTEYWQFQDPATAENTRKCVGSEDPTCSATVPPALPGDAHGVYYGQVFSSSQAAAFCQ